MAAIIPNPGISAYQVPATPIKNDVIVSSSEVVPDYSPGAAPVYNKDGDVFTGPTPNMMPPLDKIVFPVDPLKPHPVLPIGDVFFDARDHLICHNNYNLNIDTLLRQFRLMKDDLDAARKAQAQAEREAIKEREEKEAALAQVVVLEEALRESQEELAIVRADLVASEERLRLAIIQLTEAVRKLELARNELRVVRHERDVLARKVIEVERELAFYKARCAQLQTALETANAGENAANDRNTRLTAMLYQIEAHKAAIERIKDQAESRVRELELILEEIRKEPRGDSKLRELILQLRQEVYNQDIIIQRLEREKAELQKKLDEANGQITNLDQEISRLYTEIKSAKDWSKIWQEMAEDYENIAKGLHKKCRRKFPVMKIQSADDGSVKLELLQTILTSAYGDADSDDEVEAESSEQPKAADEVAKAESC